MSKLTLVSEMGFCIMGIITLFLGMCIDSLPWDTLVLVVVVYVVIAMMLFTIRRLGRMIDEQS